MTRTPITWEATLKLRAFLPEVIDAAADVSRDAAVMAIEVAINTHARKPLEWAVDAMTDQINVYQKTRLIAVYMVA